MQKSYCPPCYKQGSCPGMSWDSDSEDFQGSDFSNNIPGQVLGQMDGTMQQPAYPSIAINPQYPTGMPAGQSMNPPPVIPGAIQQGRPSQTHLSQEAAAQTHAAGMALLQNQLSQMPGAQSQMPQTLQDVYFTPGFLRTQIGKTVRVEFLIGTNAPLIDRTGVLMSVGASYILIRPVETDDVMYCDIYSIKFVTIFY